MAPSEDITLGELSRSLKGLEGRINEQFTNINQRLDTLQYVPRGEYDVQVNQMKSDIKELEERLRWMVRTVVASFLFPVLVAIVVFLVVRR